MIFDFDDIKQQIKNSSVDSSIYIGADSKVYREGNSTMVAYVTVIILHYGSNKGAKIFRCHKTERYFGQIKQRLMTEVQEAISAAMEVADSIGDRSFEIHLDINRNKKHKSSEIIKEATGYVLGMLGIEPKLKPYSFAASSVADRFCCADAKRKKRTKLKLK